MLSASTIILIIFLAASFAALYTYYHKRILGDFIRLLDKRDAVSPDAALTLDELGINKAKALALRFSCGKGTSLRRFVAPAFPEEDENGERIEGLPEQRYFLIPEKREDALMRFDSKGLSFISVIICIAAMGAFALVVNVLLPYIQAFLGESESNFVPDDSVGEEISDTLPEKDGTVDDTENAEAPESSGSRYDTVE